MRVDVGALRSELADDPGGVGYGPMVAGGATDALAAALNEVRVGTLVSRGTVSARQLAYEMFQEALEMKLAGNAAALAAVGAPDAVAVALTTVDRDVFAALFACFAEVDAIPVESPQFVAYLAMLQAKGILRDRTLADGTALTVAQQVGLLTQRAGSRAEALFGPGAVVTGEDVAGALREA